MRDRHDTVMEDLIEFRSFMTRRRGIEYRPRDLAKDLGVSTRTVSRWEAGGSTNRAIHLISVMTLMIEKGFRKPLLEQ